jgi:hypothetical protein
LVIYGLSRRSTGDVLVLLIASTVCIGVLAGGAALVTIELVHPSTDSTFALKALQDTVNTLLGLVAGFLAGRTYGARGETDEAGETDQDEGGLS